MRTLFIIAFTAFLLGFNFNVIEANNFQQQQSQQFLTLGTILFEVNKQAAAAKGSTIEDIIQDRVQAFSNAGIPVSISNLGNSTTFKLTYNSKYTSVTAVTQILLADNTITIIATMGGANSSDMNRESKTPLIQNKKQVNN